MICSVFDLFKIGIGPSSSHTVGPMIAVRRFLLELAERGLFDRIARVHVELYGSLALTGRGHATDRAILLGLSGETPEAVDPDRIPEILASIARTGRIALLGRREIPFREADAVAFVVDRTLPRHPNGMCLSAWDGGGMCLERALYYSIGGGFVVREGEGNGADAGDAHLRAIPMPFRTATEMLARGRSSGLSIADMMMANECAMRPKTDVLGHLDRVRQVMNECIERGFATNGILPGGLNVKRRASAIHASLRAARGSNVRNPNEAMEWTSAFAIAVNEENAAGGRVVTAPTNGAAGIVPAVLRYYETFCDGASRAGAREYLLTAAAIGSLFKANASISGAEVGCQGEVGVAASMAAAGLAAALGGTNEQVENAAEIAMEHHLGMTCDPIGGLVQIPCIERNAMGSVKAISAASLALRGDGSHRVSLDEVIAAMRETGRDMSSKYKETSLGGLAATVPKC